MMVVGKDEELTVHEALPEQREAILEEAAQALAGCTRVRLAWAHGSFLEGAAFRDIDIAVQFYGPPSWRDPGLVAQAVWEAIGRPPYDVDVVPLNDAVPFFRRKVADEGRLLLEREAGEASEFGGLAASEVIELMEWKRIQEVGG